MHRTTTIIFAEGRTLTRATLLSKATKRVPGVHFVGLPKDIYAGVGLPVLINCYCYGPPGSYGTIWLEGMEWSRGQKRPRYRRVSECEVNVIHTMPNEKKSGWQVEWCPDINVHPYGIITLRSKDIERLHITWAWAMVTGDWANKQRRFKCTSS